MVMSLVLVGITPDNIGSRAEEKLTLKGSTICFVKGILYVLSFMLSSCNLVWSDLMYRF